MRYTDNELTAAYIADLRADIRCAERDGLLDYAAERQAELAALLVAPTVKIGRYGVPCAS